MNKKNFNKKIFRGLSSILIFLMVSMPFSVFAVEGENSGGDNSAVSSDDNQNSGGDSAGGAVVEGVVGCTVGQIAANIVGGAINAGLGAVGTLVNQVTGGVSNIISTKVDVSDKTNQTINAQGQIKESSASTGTDDYFSGLKNILKTSGLDAIGFCIANEMIHYIAQSTIQWINSGFEGSPVFVDNPDAFFQNIADRELGSFANGLAQGTLGINLCEPFKVQVVLDTLSSNSRGSSAYSNRLNCTLDRIKENYEQFTGGDWNSGGFPGWFELIQEPNNIYGARYEANRQALIEISRKQNTATVEINWARGYKSFKICDGEKDEFGKCSVEERTVTGGQYLEHQINERGASGLKRLYVADEFDEVVTALVNQLIKIAINETFDTSDNNSAELQRKYEEENRQRREELIEQLEEQQKEYEERVLQQQIIRQQQIQAQQAAVRRQQNQNNSNQTATTTEE